MKKLLSAIAGAGIVAMATLASAPAQAQIGGNTDSASDDLTSVLNDDDYEVSDELEQLVTELPALLAVLEQQGLLEDPDGLDSLYNSYYAGSGSGYNADGWVISKGGCSVDVGCTLGEIGVVTALQTYASAGLEPEAVAAYLQENHPDKYLAAASCTFGDCPAFAALPSQLVATSTCQYEQNATLAGNVLLKAPATWSEDVARPLSVDLLFKG